MKEYKILPKHLLTKDLDSGAAEKAAVIAHLYYEAGLENSLRYLCEIPEDVEVYIITANPALRQTLQERVAQGGMRRFQILSKPNRGRDFAALFVTAKELLPRYEYIGFVHDKRSYAGDEDALGETWERCLFESVVGSGPYVCNVVSAFEDDPSLGVLCAPIPPEPFLLGLRGGMWTGNYANAVSFLADMGIELSTGEEEDPQTIGGAFWFRRAALQKLIDRDLCYEDFPPEPMPRDNCIAHVLERVIGIVAEAAGFRCAYVMSDEYAEYFTALNESYLSMAILTLRKRRMLRFNGNRTDMELTYRTAMRNLFLSELKDYCSRYRKCFVIRRPGYPDAEACVETLRHSAVRIGTVYDADAVDLSVLSNPEYGIVICVPPEEEAAIAEMLSPIGRHGFLYKP